ncbi:MAG: Asp23/Gls24 family envelope stress response protein [Coriobacteriia bacterium]|nr:Asp23/Gls24 family envelope stress response protein [Coriobacteriia bacterium]
MSDEIRLDGLGVAPGVLDTIVTVAAENVEGVASVGASGLVGLVQRGRRKGAARAVDVVVLDDGSLAASVHIHTFHGYKIHEVAAGVQSAVAGALSSQVGIDATVVDVYVDGLVFID